MVQHQLKLVLAIRSPAVNRVARLRPDVARIVRRTAQIKRYEVILLINAKAAIRVTPLANLLPLLG